jgi:hypothetical protein
MATIIRKERALALSAVDATALDGTTAGQTYQADDRLATACVSLEKDTDAVIIYITGTGSANNSMVFNIYGYGEDGPAERILISATATLGTAIPETSKLYADTIVGTDYHTSTVGIFDSGNNTICKIKFDTQGLRHLYFEPTTFTTMTACTFHVREVGQI